MRQYKRDNVSKRLINESIKFLDSVKNKNIRITKISEGDNKIFEGKLIHISNRGGLVFITEDTEHYYILKLGDEVIYKVYKNE